MQLGIFELLKALPAIFGVVGLFVFLWSPSQSRPQILEKIVEKLRNDPHLEAKQLKTIDAKRLKIIIDKDSKLRGQISREDYKLLDKIITDRTRVTIVAMAVSFVLVALSVWLFTRPTPATIYNLRVVPDKATGSPSDAELVDLDTWAIEWSADGSEEVVSVFLENAETSARTEKRHVSSKSRRALIKPSDYKSILAQRRYGRFNAIRAVIETASTTVTSEVREAKVGVSVELTLNGHDVEGNAIHLLLAYIDASTETIPANSCFKASLVGRGKTGQPLVEILQSCNNNGVVQPAILDKLDPFGSPGLVYQDGPFDASQVRTAVNGFH